MRSGGERTPGRLSGKLVMQLGDICTEAHVLLFHLHVMLNALLRIVLPCNEHTDVSTDMQNVPQRLHSHTSSHRGPSVCAHKNTDWWIG